MILVPLLAIVGVAYADEPGDAVLKGVAGKLAAYGDYKVEFSVTAKDMGTVGGSYVVSGDKYRIRLQKQEQFSDGRNRYEVYPSDKEIVIDAVDASSHDIFSNPTKAFEFAPSEFESRLTEVSVRGGMRVQAVELTPRQGNGTSGIIILYVDAVSGLPAAIDYDYQGEKVSVKIDRIEKLDDVDKSLFIFDPMRYKDYEVIDFR